jgi:iron complex outermembrane receptor protein
LATIPLSTVERVEVYRGVIPPSFGGSGTAGVINFTTRSPSDSLRWGYGLSYGTWDTRMAHGWLSRRVGPVASVVALDYSHSDNDFSYWDDNGTPVNPADDEWARRRNNQFLSFNVLARLSSPAGSRLRWAASYSHLHTNNHLPGNSTFHEIPSTARWMSDQHLAEGVLGGALPYLTEGEVRLYRSFRRDQFADRDGLVSLGKADTDDTTNVWGGQLSLATLVVPYNRPSLNGSFQREGFDPYDRLITDEAARARLFFGSRRARYALYLSDELELSDRRVMLTGQLGHERVRNNTLQDAPVFGPNRIDTSVAQAWPRALGLMAVPRPWLRLRANWGRYLRLPNLYELFGNRGSSVGNGLLRPETGVNRDLGVEVRGDLPGLHLRAGSAELVYFQSTVTDMIAYWTVYNRSKPFNVGGADIRGIEASTSFGTAFGLSVSTNFTWQRPRNTSTLYDSLYYGNDLPNRPRLLFDLRAQYARGPTTLLYGVQAHGPFYGQPANGFADIVPATWIFDAGLRVRLADWLVLTLEGKNLTDIRRFDSRYVPLPGRSWFVSVQGTSG